MNEKPDPFEDEIDYGPLPPRVGASPKYGSNGSEAPPGWTEASIGGTADAPVPKLSPISFVRGEVLPPREWIAADWIPTRKTTLIQGDGGDGKTTLLQQLQSSCATGLTWIGMRVEECVTVGFYTEDEEADIKERQAAIDISYNQHCASYAYGRPNLFPRADEENELVVFDRTGKPTLTPFYRQIRETVLDLKARLLVLDVAVDLFGGDEIKRREVRAFWRPLGRLGREMNGAIVMSSHMSQAGIRSDGGHSGSTDWSNAGRSRLYLARPKPDGGDEPTDPDARLLTRKKANFARIGDVIKMHWKDGLLIPDGLLTGSGYVRHAIEDVFLTLLDERSSQNRKVSSDPHSRNYAPKEFGKMPARDREDYREADFKRAMETLFKRHLIKNIEYGRRGHEAQRIMHVRDAGGNIKGEKS